MRTSYLVRGVLPALAVVPMLSAAADCSLPKNPEQRIVCGNAELLALDRQVSTAYRDALAQPGIDRADLECDQSLWENSGLQCYGRVECIKQRYLDRIATLKAHAKPNISAFNKRLCEVQRQAAGREAAEEARRAAQPAEFNARLQAGQERGKRPAASGEAGRVDAGPQRAESPVEAKRRFDEAQAGAGAEATRRSSDAQNRYDELNKEKQTIMTFLRVFQAMGPMPSLESTVPRGSRRKGASVDSGTNDEASDKIEQQLPQLRAEAARRQQRAVAHAKEVLQRCTARFPAAIELESLIADSGSFTGTIRAFEAAEKLDSAMKAFAATKQRAGEDIASAQADIASAAKVPGDADIATAARTASQTAQELSAKARSNDPGDEPQISAVAGRLEAQQAKLTRLMREKAALASATGKQVYQGCLAWAERRGMGTSSGVKIFKDEATNKAADIAVNTGTVVCRCMAAEIAGDPEITDAAKVEIAHQFQSRDKMNNQALAAVVAVAGGRCQLEMVDQLSGGQLSGGR